ncbi:MAG: BrnT family toxin [Burkholderiales bacterium]|nr:BrnT family toxin [Burkholderiales bacterium]
MNVSTKIGIPDYEFRVVFGHTKIDYDPNKEGTNRKKHGYSLESAVHILERSLLPSMNPKRHAVSDPFLKNGEMRHMHLCVDDSDNVVLMVTTMLPDETVRIISFRKAHKDERELSAANYGYA